jgi:6-pyruvoyltetrahydropterin/6-carboxytetrahydropterin synthase
MPLVRITKEFHFEMAHALWNYTGPCRNIHGHSYRLFVTIQGFPLDVPGHPNNGMLIDFSELKMIVKENIIEVFDHALVVYKGAPSDFMQNVEQMFEKYYKLDYQPTCENLVADMAKRIAGLLPPNTALHSLRLHETATSYAEWFAVDNPTL